VDNSPAEKRLTQFLNFPSIIASHQIIENPQNTGFGAGCNLGAARARGEILFFLNPDCVFQGGSFAAIISRLENDEKIGAIGPKLIDSNGRVEFSWSSFPSIWAEAKLKFEKILSGRVPPIQMKIEARFEKARDVDWLTGGAFFMRHSTFDEIGGFDERFFLYFEDADLCKRINQTGYLTCYDPSFTLIHDRGGSIEESGEVVAESYRRSQVLYYQKHKNPLSRMALGIYLHLTKRYPSKPIGS